MAVSKRLRYEVLRRDNHTCRYCGGKAPDVVLTVDHVVATALGGTDEPGNLVAACRDCNSGKSATPADAALVADVAQDALRMAAAMQLLRDQAVVERDEQIKTEKAVWEQMKGWAHKMPAAWFDSVDRFLVEGLAHVEIVDAAITADALRYGDPWRYFCGICWKKIRARQERAAEMMRQSEAERTSSNPHCDEPDCPAHGTNNVPCPTCNELDCDWFCATAATREYIERNTPRPTPQDIFAAGLYDHLALVVDGVSA